MQFSYSRQQDGGRFGKFAIVAGLHVALALGVIQALDIKRLALPVPDGLVVTFTPDLAPPPPPPDPPRPIAPTAPPKLFVPPLEIPVAPPPVSAALHATTTDPAPQPAVPVQQTTADVPPASTPAAAQPGAIRSAVFADANACALPAYPSRALRNGDSGTTTLALLVGTDGRVTSARVERSSGSRELDQAAIHALSLCTFKPALNDGVAAAGWARLAYVWTLD